MRRILSSQAWLVILVLLLPGCSSQPEERPDAGEGAREAAQAPAGAAAEPSEAQKPAQDGAAPAEAGPKTPEVTPGRSGDGKYLLTANVNLEAGEQAEATALSLLAAMPSPPSDEEAETVQQALTALRHAIRSDPEAATVLVQVEPKKACQWFAEAYDDAEADAREAIAKAAMREEGEQADALIVRGLIDREEDVRNAVGWALDTERKAGLGNAALGACKTASPENLIRLLDYVGCTGNEDPLPRLKELAGHEHLEVRAKAVERIAVIGTDAAVGHLREALTEPSSSVRRAALRGLKDLDRLEESDLVTALETADEDAKAAVLEMMPAPQDAALRAVVIEALQADDPSLRSKAVEAIGRFGNPAGVRVLVHRLENDDSEDVREAAARALGQHGAVSDLMPLVGAAKNEDEESDVRQAASRALGAAGPEGVRAAIEQMSPSDSSYWDVMVEGLTSQKKPDLSSLIAVAEAQNAERGEWEALAAACEKLDPAERLALARAILERGNGYGQAPVIELLGNDASPESFGLLRDACSFPNVLPNREIGHQTDIVRAGNQFLLTFGSKEGNVWELLLEALESAEEPLRREAEETLVRTAVASAGDADPEFRAGAVRIIGRFAAKPNAALLREATGDEATPVQLAVAQAMAGLPPESAAPILKKLAQSEAYGVREAVAESVAALGGDSLRPVAESLLADSDEDVQAAAVGAIAPYPDLADRCLETAAKLRSHERQQIAVGSLARLPAPRAAEALGRLAAQAEDDDISVKALQKIGELHEAGVLTSDACADALAKTLAGGSAFRRLVAACCLAGADAPSALPVLVELAEGDVGERTVLVGQEFTGGVSEIGPERVRLVARPRFPCGYKSTGLYTTTYFAQMPIRFPRRRAAFGDGDRWPLDLELALEDLHPAIIALARYDDPRATAAIEEALQSESRTKRRSALWAKALKDDVKPIASLLDDEDSAVAADAVNALRMLGHRSALPVLAARFEDSTVAAIAVVEIVLYADRERRISPAP